MLVDRLFSNGRNVWAEVVTVCFEIIIKIYKVTTVNQRHMKVSFI